MHSHASPAHDFLTNYLAKIRYEGSREPTRETLFAIHKLHCQAFPFSNLSLHSHAQQNKPISLARDAIWERLTEDKGGYCLELNEILAQALIELGFTVDRYLGRSNGNREFGTKRIKPLNPRTHEFLLVTIENEKEEKEKFIADASWAGFNGFFEPIPFCLGEEVMQGSATFRIIKKDESKSKYAILVREDEHWNMIYSFTLNKIAQKEDFESASKKLDNSTFFGRTLLCARFYSEDKRKFLFNTHLTTFQNQDKKDSEADSATKLWRKLKKLDIKTCTNDEEVISKIETMKFGS